MENLMKKISVGTVGIILVGSLALGSSSDKRPYTFEYDTLDSVLRSGIERRKQVVEYFPGYFCLDIRKDVEISQEDINVAMEEADTDGDEYLRGGEVLDYVHKMSSLIDKWGFCNLSDNFRFRQLKMKSQKKTI